MKLAVEWQWIGRYCQGNSLTRSRDQVHWCCSWGFRRWWPRRGKNRILCLTLMWSTTCLVLHYCCLTYKVNFISSHDLINQTCVLVYLLTARTCMWSSSLWKWSITGFILHKLKVMLYILWNHLHSNPLGGPNGDHFLSIRTLNFTQFMRGLYLFISLFTCNQDF